MGMRLATQRRSPAASPQDLEACFCQTTRLGPFASVRYPGGTYSLLLVVIAWSGGQHIHTIQADMVAHRTNPGETPCTSGAYRRRRGYRLLVGSEGSIRKCQTRR